jgi:hypothetical protein
VTAHIIAVAKDNLITLAFIAGLIVAVAQIGRLRRPFTTADVSGIVLDNYLLYGVGIGQVLAFALHSFQPGLVIAHALARPACARPRRAESGLPEQLPDGGRAGYGQVMVG